MRGVQKVVKNAAGNNVNLPINIYNPRETITPLDFNELPTDYRNTVEIAVFTLLDQDRGKVVVVGSAQSGKSFFGAQVLYSTDRFLERYGLGDLTPVRLTRPDFNDISPYVDSISSYLRGVAEELAIDVTEICIVTEDPEVAARVADAGLGVRILLEVSEAMFHSIANAQSQGKTSIWSNWDFFDITELKLRRSEIVTMVQKAHAERLADFYSVELKPKHTMAVINALMSVCEAMQIDSGNSQDPYFSASPAYVALVVKRFIQLASAEFDFDGSRASTAEFIERAISHLEPYLVNAHIQAHKNASVTEAEVASDNTMPAPFGAFDSDEEAELFDGAFTMGAQDLTPEINDPYKMKFRSLKALENSLKKEIIGQDAAVSRVVDALTIPAADMHDESKPLRTFLFLGPTGVGKTELSRQLAAHVATEPLNVIRLDMGEYTTEGSTTSLFGTHPGYIGYDKEGGTLTREVAKNPNSLIILDEIEKALPSTWDAFLQVLDAGRMTTGSGKVVDFSNCIIVMTSNLGTEEMSARSVGFADPLKQTKSLEELERIAKNALKKYLRVEFINRIDEIIVFQQLDSDSARKIVAKEIRSLSKKLKSRGHELGRASNDILDSILKSSDFSQYGARDVQRTIQKNVSVPLARMVLQAGKTPKKFKLKCESDSSTISVTEA